MDLFSRLWTISILVLGTCRTTGTRSMCSTSSMTTRVFGTLMVRSSWWISFTKSVFSMVRISGYLWIIVTLVSNSLGCVWMWKPNHWFSSRNCSQQSTRASNSKIQVRKLVVAWIIGNSLISRSGSYQISDVGIRTIHLAFICHLTPGAQVR